jgi:hypothetical protein
MLLGGRDINLDAALPLRIKDWKALKTKGVTIEGLRKGEDIELMSNLCEYVLEKAEHGSGALINEMTLQQMTNVLNSITAAEAREADRPT